MAKSGKVQSLCRALDIVNELTRSESGLGLREVSEKVGLKITTVHNLIKTLRQRKFVDKNSKGRYILGPAFDEINQLRFKRGILERAENILKKLRQQYPISIITFSELIGDEIFCRLRISADFPDFVKRPLAMTFGAFVSATGLCLLAFNDEFCEKMLSSGMFEESMHMFHGNREKFKKALSETHKRGMAILQNGGKWRFAVPVSEHFVLGLSVDDRDITEELKNKIICDLPQFARQIAYKE